MNITWKQSSEGEVETPYKKNPSSYKSFQTKLPNNSLVTVIQTPETRSLLIAHHEDEKLVPARLYLGMKRSKDLCAATYVLTATKEFKSAINHRFIPEKQAISAMLIREPISQAPFVNTYLGSGLESRLYAVMDVHHVKDEDGIKGMSGKVCSYRIDIPEEKSEEIHNDIKLGILYDSIAGGRNLIAAVENLKERFKNLEKVVFVSVYATYEGCKRVEERCNELGLECEFFCMHELLTASPLNEYDCFYPQWHICKEDIELLKQFYGDKYNKICIGGDWTANSLGVEQARSVYFEQLRDVGIELNKGYQVS